MDDDFKLVVGETYVDGEGERAVCQSELRTSGNFLCVGADTGAGVYEPDGVLLGTRLRPAERELYRLRAVTP